MPFILSDQELNREFVRKIKEISGEDVYKCMQCGTCAGACPMREVMDLSPTRAIHMVHFGQLDKLNESNTVWMCASCHNCEARCPRGIDLPKVMEAIRLLSLRQNENYVEPNDLEEEKIKELPPIAMVASFRKHTA